MTVSRTHLPPKSELLDTLRILLNPSALVHIGAGHGAGELAIWQHWELDAVLVADADAARLAWMDETADARRQKRVAVLADSAAPRSFFVKSNPAEDGLYSAQMLQAIWPNLHDAETCQRETITLDALLQETGTADRWRRAFLLLDCLPAAPILAGAAEVLATAQLVWARVLLDENADPAGQASLAAVSALLSPYRYRCIRVFEGNHPALGEAVFVRDPEADVQLLQLREQTLQQLLQQGRQELEERGLELLALARARDEFAEQSAGVLRIREQELHAVRAELADLQAQGQAQSGAYSAELRLLQEENAHLLRMAQARELETAELRREELKYQQRVAELQADAEGAGRGLDLLRAQLSAMQNEVAGVRDGGARQVGELGAQSQALEQAQRELEQSRAAVQERELRIAALQEELQAQQGSQQLLSDEMLKAEAQLELIKDLLLREERL